MPSSRDSGPLEPGTRSADVVDDYRAQIDRIRDALAGEDIGQDEGLAFDVAVLHAAWEEMHREAREPSWYALNRLSGLTLEDTAGDGVGRYTAADKAKILDAIRDRADTPAAA